ILHRDLKPSNVLVVDGQVKVLDFGLASKFGEEGRESGTLAYIAPETLAGQQTSAASDLYSVGVIAYEIFAKHHPFKLDILTGLIQQIVSTVPDVDSLDIPPSLKPLLARLLAKDPKARFQDASEIFEAFEVATGQKLPFETAATRESFLQAAQFVGRDN